MTESPTETIARVRPYVDFLRTSSTRLTSNPRVLELAATAITEFDAFEAAHEVEMAPATVDAAPAV